MGKLHRIALISDTHGLVRPELLEALQGVEEILHGGDVGHPDVLRALEQIAPVTAVSGNVDVGVPGLNHPSFARRELYGLSVLITHYVGSAEQPMPPVAAAIRTGKPQLVLSGHTHKPLVETQAGILYVNPGSCGPKRFSLPCSFGVLTLDVTEGKRPTPDVMLYDLELGGKLSWREP